VEANPYVAKCKCIFRVRWLTVLPVYYFSSLITNTRITKEPDGENTDANNVSNIIEWGMDSVRSHVLGLFY
jgi:hypothetical protein